ncbi:MAG: MATE family efflux transporter [Oscillospiraceae bacterium]|nr:MATE family efflux transporter [Oscillospiraceae bacterium]
MNLRKFVGDRAFYRKLFAVMVPILIQNVITNFVSLLDNVMVGQVGTESMSGVAIVNQLFFVFFVCIFGGLSGAGILTAQFYGKGDTEGIRHTLRTKLWIGLVTVLLFGAVFLARGDRLIGLFLHEGEEALDLQATLRHGREYLSVMLLQMLPFALTQVYAGTLRETGETVLPMKAGIAAVCVNLVFNYILIFGKLGAPALGVVGAAAATVLSRLVECAVVVSWTHRHAAEKPWARGAFRSLRVPRAVAKRILLMGAPLLANEFLWSGGMTVLNQCYSLRGLEVVSALNIATTVSNLFFCAFLAMGNATAILVGQLLGAGELERAVDEDRKLIAFSVALSTAVGAVMALVAPLVPQIYNTTALVKALAVRLLLISAVMMPVNAFTNSCYFTLRSGGKTLITFVFDSMFVWVVSIPAAMFLSRCTAMPIVLLYLTIYLLDLIKCVIGYVMVKKRGWVVNLVAR